MDDGTERLRGQLRDAAQDGRSGEDYGGDRIEDTAANIPRQAVRGAEEMVRQIRLKRKEAQDKSADIHYPQPEEAVSEQPLDLSPDIGDSKAIVEDFPTTGSQPRDSKQTPFVRAREPAAPQTTEHLPIKEKIEQISAVEKPAVTARVSQDGPAVKTKESAGTTPASQDVPSSIHHPRPQPSIRPFQQVKAEQLRDSDHALSVKVKESAAPQTGAEYPPIKEKTGQISVAEKPAVTARVSQDGPAVKIKEPAVTTPVSQDAPLSIHHPKPRPVINLPQQLEPEQPIGVTPGVSDFKAIAEDIPAAGPHPRESNQRTPVRAREPAAPQAAEHPLIKEKTRQVSIAEKPAATARINQDRPAVKL